MNKHKFQTFLQTPFKRWVGPLNVLTEEYLIKAYSKKVRYFRVPLLDDKSGIRYTAEVIKERIDHKKNAPILVTGDPGSGKSTVISKTARKIDPAFDVCNVGFTLEEFNSIFRRLPRGDGSKGIYPQVNMDESAFAAFTDERLKSEQTGLAKDLIISRIDQKIVYFGAPKPKLLNNRVRDLATIWIHVSEPDYDLQGYAEVHLPPPQKQSKYATAKYWEPSYAFIFKPEEGDFWKRYEEKKIAFVQAAHEGTLGKSPSGRAIMLAQITQLDTLGLKTDEAKAQFYGITRERIGQIRRELAAVKT